MHLLLSDELSGTGCPESTFSYELRPGVGGTGETHPSDLLMSSSSGTGTLALEDLFLYHQHYCIEMRLRSQVGNCGAVQTSLSIALHVRPKPPLPTTTPEDTFPPKCRTIIAFPPPSYLSAASCSLSHLHTHSSFTPDPLPPNLAKLHRNVPPLIPTTS